MLRTGGLACVRSTRFLVGPSRLSAAHPVALLTSSRTSQRPGWGAAGSSRGLCAAPEASPKIQALVDQISGLTLLEASELTDALKEKLALWGFRSFRVHLPSLAYDFGHGDVDTSETSPLAMKLSPHHTTEQTARLAHVNASYAFGKAARAAAARTERITHRPVLRGAALELAASPFVYDPLALETANVELRLTCRRDAADVTAAPGEGERCAHGVLQPALALALDARPARGALVAAELRDDGTVAPLARALGVPVDHQMRAQLQVPNVDSEVGESTLRRKLGEDAVSQLSGVTMLGEMLDGTLCLELAVDEANEAGALAGGSLCITAALGERNAARVRVRNEADACEAAESAELELASRRAHAHARFDAEFDADDTCGTLLARAARDARRVEQRRRAEIEGERDEALARTAELDRQLRDAHERLGLVGEG